MCCRMSVLNGGVGISVQTEACIQIVSSENSIWIIELPPSRCRVCPRWFRAPTQQGGRNSVWKSQVRRSKKKLVKLKVSTNQTRFMKLAHSPPELRRRVTTTNLFLQNIMMSRWSWPRFDVKCHHFIIFIQSDVCVKRPKSRWISGVMATSV